MGGASTRARLGSYGILATAQPVLVVAVGLRSLGDTAKVLGDQGRGERRVAFLSELLERRRCAFDVFARLSCLHHPHVRSQLQTLGCDRLAAR